VLFGLVAQPLVATIEDGSKQLAGIIKAQRLTQLWSAITSSD